MKTLTFYTLGGKLIDARQMTLQAFCHWSLEPAQITIKISGDNLDRDYTDTTVRALTLYRKWLMKVIRENQKRR